MVSPFVDRQHGTERAVAELIDRLAYVYGCEIHLYAQHVENLDLLADRGSTGLPSGSIRWHRVPSLPGPHLLQFLGWIFLNKVWRWWDTTFRKVSFDLVLSLGINSFDADVVIVHVLFHRLMQFTREGKNTRNLSQSGILRRLHRRAYYYLLSRMERRIYADPRITIGAVSKRIADLLGEFFGRRDVTVIPNGVDRSCFSPAARLAQRSEARELRGFRTDDLVLLLIGNDWSTKGLHTIVEALSSLQQLPLQLLVVGSDDPDSFRARAKELGVLDRCHFEPPNPNVLEFFSASDFYVSPSSEDSFGLPVAEAMVCGLPVVTSIFAGVSEHVHDGVDGFVLSNPRDTESLVKIVRALCENPELRTRIGGAAAKNAQQFSWDRNAAEVWALLQRVIKNNKGRP